MLRSLARWLRQFRLFARDEPPRSAWEIIRWWEARRIPYNLIVGVSGILTGFLLIANAFVTERVLGEAIGIPDPPLFAVMGIILYGVVANLCYTGGWIVEVLRRFFRREPNDSFGEVAFTNGTIFSVLLTLLPAAIAISVGCFRMFSSRK